jgi:integrase
VPTGGVRVRGGVPGKRPFGTVRRLPSGRWQARHWTAGGRQLPAPQTFATKKDAARWLATVEADRARGAWVDPAGGKQLLADYARTWLDGHVGIGARTRKIYEQQLRLCILPAVSDTVPALGEHHLAEITADLVRAWYLALRRHKSPSTAAKAYTRLRQIIGQAVKDERILRNPCRVEGAGIEHQPEQRFWTMADLRELAAMVPDDYRALIWLAGLGGLRQGELFAVRWRDLDLERGVVQVRRKRLRLASGEVVEDAPKRAAGRRSVALPAPVVDELRDHLDALGVVDEDDYVFTSPDGHPLERSNFRRRVWLPATEAAGLGGLRFHDLPHTAGTLAARTGATTKELMARFGHASPQAAMIYQHAAEERDRLIADRLGEMVADEIVAPVVAIKEAMSRRARNGAPDDQARSRHGKAGS